MCTCEYCLGECSSLPVQPGLSSICKKDFGSLAPQFLEKFVEAEDCEIAGLPLLPGCVHGNQEIWAPSFSLAMVFGVCKVCLCNFVS